MRYGPHREHSGNLQVQSPSSDETDNLEMPLRIQPIEFLGKTISPEGISAQAWKIKKILDELIFAQSKILITGISELLHKFQSQDG